MSVWLTIPSKRPPEETTLHLWRERGYKIAIWRDGPGLEFEVGLSCAPYNFTITGEYPGYAAAVNKLIYCVAHDRSVFQDPTAEWFIAAGDDIEPDLNHTAEEIAQQCGVHFGSDAPGHNTFGVMQPTGDRWGDNPSSRQMFGENRGAYADRVCGSAWIGREFACRAYRGKGPLWPEYFHMYVDEELQEVATRFGVLWQRRDLIHLHRHWGRGPIGRDNTLMQTTSMPEHLKKANDGFLEARELFNQRKAAGFPGSELL